MANITPDSIFEDLYSRLQEQATLLAEIADKLNNLELGKGMATITDYVSGSTYKRNMLIVDPATETVYRSTQNFVAQTVETDCSLGYLKLVGFESQIVTFDHEPTQLEINTVPDGAMVAIYSPADTPYTPGSPE